MAVDIGDEDRLQRLAHQVIAQLGRNEGHRQSGIRCDRGDARLPLAAPQRIVARFGFHRLHEALAALPDPEAQPVLVQQLFWRVVIDRLQVLAAASVARMGGNDRRLVEGVEAVRGDQQLQLDFAGRRHRTGRGRLVGSNRRYGSRVCVGHRRGNVCRSRLARRWCMGVGCRASLGSRGLFLGDAITLASYATYLGRIANGSSRRRRAGARRCLWIDRGHA